MGVQVQQFHASCQTLIYHAIEICDTQRPSDIYSTVQSYCNYTLSMAYIEEEFTRLFFEGKIKINDTNYFYVDDPIGWRRL